MEVIPALDLRDGQVVRLRHGAFDEETVYKGDPCATARRWVAQGARRLHIVDLDGARKGRPVQAPTIDRILAAADVPCQVAGGLRDAAAVAAALEAGAERVVLGTAILDRPRLAADLVARHGAARIVAALDVRDGQAVGDGWVATARGRPLHLVLANLVEAGIERLILTAIARDGDLAGPDLDLVAAVRDRAPGIEIIASGGIRGLEDLRALAGLGCAAAIVGRALYEGQLDLTEAIAAV